MYVKHTIASMMEPHNSIELYRMPLYAVTLQEAQTLYKQSLLMFTKQLH